MVTIDLTRLVRKEEIKARVQQEQTEPGQEQAQEPGQAVRKFRTARELFAAPQRLQWLVKDWIEAGTCSALLGEPGAGKTFAALRLAACIATGTAFHEGVPVMQGPVAIVEGEGQASAIRRLLALDLHFEGSLSESGNLHLCGTPLKVDDPDTLDAVLGELAQINPVLVVLDTLNRTSTGDENSTGDMTAYVRALDTIREKMGAAVLLLHHPSKADPHELRGSSALKGALDSVAMVQKRTGKLALIQTKNRSGDLAKPCLFSFDPVLMPSEWAPEGEGVHHEAVLVPTSPEEQEGPEMDEKEGKLLVLIEGLLAANRDRLREGGHDPKGARLTTKEVVDASPLGRSRTFALLKALERDEHIVRKNGFIELKQEVKQSMDSPLD